MAVLKKDSVKKAERVSVESGIFSFRELMKTAGETCAHIICENYNLKGKKVAVICGTGNNGGDGFVCANVLKEICETDVIIPLGLPKTPDAQYYFEKLSGVEILDSINKEYDFLIDALFGIGLNRPLEDDAKEIINLINRMNAVRIAIDIPSGTECDSGKILGVCAKCDLTVTFIALKPCLLLPPSSDYCGKTVVADIGVAVSSPDYHIIKNPKFEPRNRNSHKGTFGTALSITGSFGMCGAAILSARAALRSGVGILKAVVCDEIYSPFTCAVPEAVCIPVKTGKFGSPNHKDKKIYEALNSAKAVLIGCGLGNNPDTEKLVKKIIKESNIPIVLDADGINSIADSIDIIAEAKAPIILTPHPGEMARICGVSVKEIEQNRICYATKTAKRLNAIIVLKGANTIVALPDGEIYFNLTGNPGMAKGGSGDVLAGITVSLLAQSFSPEDAAKNAVYIHGSHGDLAKVMFGEMGMLPSDIIESL